MLQKALIGNSVSQTKQNNVSDFLPLTTAEYWKQRPPFPVESRKEIPVSLFKADQKTCIESYKEIMSKTRAIHYNVPL